MPMEIERGCEAKPAWKNVTSRGGVINANGMALIRQELDSPLGNRGSEKSGSVSDVLIQNCTFHQSFSLASVKNCRERGSVIERMLYEKIQMVNTSTEHDMTKWFKGAIYNKHQLSSSGSSGNEYAADLIHGPFLITNPY